MVLTKLNLIQCNKTKKPYKINLELYVLKLNVQITTKHLKKENHQFVLKTQRNYKEVYHNRQFKNVRKE